MMPCEECGAQMSLHGDAWSRCGSPNPVALSFLTVMDQAAQKHGIDRDDPLTIEDRGPHAASAFWQGD